MDKISKKDKEKRVWSALGMLIDNLIEEYGFDKIYWLKQLSASDFVIDLFNLKTGFWGEGVSFHTYRFMREMHLKSLPTVYEIKKMLECRENALIKYIAKNKTKGNLDKAKDIFYSTKTYTYLCIVDSNFYWKSSEELYYLIDRELDGDISAWEKQSDIRHSEIADLPQKIDLRNIPLEKIIGYKPPELSEEEVQKYKDKIKYLEELGIVGILDDEENPEVDADKWQASYLIETGKPLPQDLVDRLRSYKKGQI